MTGVIRCDSPAVKIEHLSAHDLWDLATPLRCYGYTTPGHMVTAGNGEPGRQMDQKLVLHMIHRFHNHGEGPWPSPG